MYPLVGRLDRNRRTLGLVRISIHAPLAGCDGSGELAITLMSKFQSTHPLRGATHDSDAMAKGIYHFNPRTPCGVRQCLVRPEGPFHPISIHAPLAGCDLGLGGLVRHGFISIHAPLAGCDVRSIRCLEDGESNFNPRTPCGVRRRCPLTGWVGGDFNPRTPCGVRRHVRGLHAY